MRRPRHPYARVASVDPSRSWSRAYVVAIGLGAFAAGLALVTVVLAHVRHAG